MEWPANSPDLNPIEHLWDELGRAVRRRVTDQTTLADLRELLVEEWDVIPQQRVRTLVNSMRRCQAVINTFGGYTRYYTFLKMPSIPCLCCHFVCLLLV